MPATVCDLLLTRRGVVFVESSGKPLADAQLRAVQLELAAVGYLMSARLEARLRVASLDEVVAFRTWALARLLAHAGGERKHEPLFRSFPAGVPADTEALWWDRVLVFFLQAEDQPCLLCRQSGTTHVLAPCRHVVCDRCFDGATYSACPVCQHAVDRRSPFFQPSPERPVPTERVTFKLLDLGDDVTAHAKALFVSLCQRKQALSPVDRDALAVVLAEHGTGVLAWLPASIPVRENVAIVFGTLFRACDPAEVLPAARRFMTTATDVLRFLAVLSGTDGSLLPERRLRRVEVRTAPSTLLAHIARLLGKTAAPGQRWVYLPERVYRFKMAKLPRGLRRALFAVLEGMDPERLVEDMLRHRSFWVWAGEFLHPHEYAARFPNLARAFHIVRGKAPDGTPAPDFHGFHSRVERAVRGRDADAMASVLAERPGELARRFDHLVRVAGADPAAVARAVSAFTGRVSAFATPVLVTLRSHLPLRDRVAPARVYWPKARVAMGVSAPDQRAVLPRAAIEPRRSQSTSRFASQRLAACRIAAASPTSARAVTLLHAGSTSLRNSPPTPPSSTSQPCGATSDAPPGSTWMRWLVRFRVPSTPPKAAQKPRIRSRLFLLQGLGTPLLVTWARSTSRAGSQPCGSSENRRLHRPASASARLSSSPRPTRDASPAR